MGRARLYDGTILIQGMTPIMAQATSAGGYRQELDRALHLRHLLVYGMVFMVPIAPMSVYGFVSRDSAGMVPLVYLVGVVAMIFTALSYKHMSAEFPIAGSVYSYVQRGLNSYIGFMAGWLILADYLLAPSLLYAFSATWLGGLLPQVPFIAWVLLFVGFNTLVNVLGIRLQARTNILLLLLELATLAIFLVVALYFVLGKGGGLGHLSIQPFYEPGKINLDFVARATSIAALSFLGFDAISTLSEETVDPQRTIGRATVLALVLLGGIFMLETYVAALAHPEYHNLSETMGFFDIGKEVGGKALYVLLIVVNVIATGIANALVAQSAISRILYSMGRDRVLPASGFLAHVHPRLKTPTNATILVGVVSILIAGLVKEEWIIKFVNFGALTAFMLLNIAVFWHFFIRKRQRRHVLSFLVFPMLGLLIVGFVWSGFDRVTFIFGGCWTLVGLVVGAFGYKRFHGLGEA